jgi:phosphatidylglycerol:prolipoprotein diacylglycerol transferase
LYPILIEIFGFPIHTFGVAVLLAAIASLSWVKYDAPRVGIDPEDMVSLGIEVFVAGLIGSRILFVWHNWDGMYVDLPWYQMFNPRTGGLIWYGGLLAATPTGFLRAKAWNVPMRQACDVMAGGIMIGLAIGRIGCLLAGDDHGSVAPEETWYTLTFTDPNALMDDAYRNKPLLPAQPLMMLGAFTLFVVLTSLRKKLAHVPSGLSSLLFVLYPIHRFLVEFVRGDPVRGHVPEDVFLFGGLSTSQAISVPLVCGALGIFVFLCWKYRGAPDPEPLPGWPGPLEVPETKGEDRARGGPKGPKPKKKDKTKDVDE